MRFVPHILFTPLTAAALILVVPGGTSQAAPTPNVDSGFGANGITTVTGSPVDTTVDSTGRTLLVTTDAKNVTRLTTLTPNGAKAQEATLPFPGLVSTTADARTSIVATGPAGKGIRIHRVGGATATVLPDRTIELISNLTTRPDGTLIVHGLDQSTTPATHLLAAVKPDGTLDPGWATNGLLTTTEDIRAVAATGNQVLTATATNVRRYTATGAPEAAFPLPTGFDPYAMSAALVSGRLGQRMAVLKILPSGAPDTSFGVAGLATGATHDCNPTARRAFTTTTGVSVIGHNADCGASRVYVQRFTSAGKDAGELVVDQVGTQKAEGRSGGGVQADGRTVVTFKTAKDTTSTTRLLVSTTVPVYTAVTPARVLVPTQVGPNKEVTVAVQGTNVAAVALDVAVARGRAPGGIVAYPTGGKAPAVNTHLHATGQSVSQRLVVPIGAGGRITLRNVSSGSAHLAANLVGWYRAGAYTPATPHRVLQARGLKARTAITFATGAPAGTKEVLVNVAVSGVSTAGNLRLYPAGTVAPTSALATHAAKLPGNATARVTLGTGGRLAIFNNAPTSANVTVDVIGYLKS